MTSRSVSSAALLRMEAKRPPFLAFAISQYRRNLLVRGLVDLTVAGLATLIFSGGLSEAWQPVNRAIKAMTSALDRPISDVRSASQSSFTRGTTGPGSETIRAMALPQISIELIEKAPSAIAAALRDARAKLLADDAAGALDGLASSDETDPTISYAKAVVTLRLPGNGQGITAQRLLRAATQKAYAPAFTLNGLVLYRLLAMDEKADLPSTERVTLDGSGRIVQVTNAQLASEAVLWWQRGGAFHDVEALRLLGMAEAKGFSGKINLSAAIAYWHDAARRGDAISRLELAHLYYEGIGVEADTDKAIDLFRQAADQGMTRAALGLGTVLTTNGITGDAEATRDAVRVLDNVAKTSSSREERGFAHWVLGVLLTEAAPLALRDPLRGIEHIRMAVSLGFRGAMMPLCRAYDTGVGVPRDPVRAAGCLMAIQSSGSADVSKDIGRLTATLDDAALARAKSFRVTQDPVSPAFEAEYATSRRAGLSPLLTLEPKAGGAKP